MLRNLLELKRIFKNHNLSESELEELRERKLRAVIRNAYEHVPYYRTLFRSAGLSPEDIGTVKDLRKLPVTAHDDWRAAGIEKITAQWVDLSKCVQKRTGGSCGKPFTVYRTPSEQRTAEVVMLASQLAAGFRPWDRFTTLGRDIHLPVHFYHRLGLYRRNVIPIRLPIELQIQRLREFQPTIINTWPSALRALMHHFKYPLRDLVNPKLIFCSSEVFDDILRERLENELDAELLNLYAAHECAQIALECPAHEGLHLQADQVILESLDNGEQVGFGHQGVAVITSLYSFAMPFIRYSLGDLVVLSDKKCSCGSSFPLMGHPIGRVNDLAKLPSGKVVSPQGFSQILQGFKGIEQWRMIQETESHFVLKLVMRHETGGEFLRSLLDQFLEYLGETVRVDIEMVDCIEKERLKFRHFVSNITP